MPETVGESGLSVEWPTRHQLRSHRGRFRAGVLATVCLAGVARIALSAQPPGPPPGAPSANGQQPDYLLSSPTLNQGEPLQGPAMEPLASGEGPPSPEQATWEIPANVPRSIGSVSALQVRPDVEMLTIDGQNVAVEHGDDGVLVIGSASGTTAGSCEALLSAVREVAPGPIRYVIDTSTDPQRVGCNATVAKAGYAFVPGVRGYHALVMAHANALLRMINQPGTRLDADAYPSETFTEQARDFAMNHQGIQVIWMPAAHTSGDSVVLFRRSDVIVTGDVFDMTRFPSIDLAHGGTLQGEIAALNQLVDFLAIPEVPKFQRPGGTLIIPGRGQLSDHADLVNYRDMLTVIRNRTQSLIDAGKSLAQIKAADVTRGYRPRYGSDSGDWTTDDFVNAVYRSLIAQKRVRKS